MKFPIELSADSRDLLVRHFKEGTDLHEIIKHAARKEPAGIEIYFFECEPSQAETLLEIPRGRWTPR